MAALHPDSESASTSGRPLSSSPRFSKERVVSASSIEHLPELMAILAHDLRNPLSALLTNIHFIQSAARGTAQDVDEALADSVLSCAILGQVIGNLEVLGGAFGSLCPSPTSVATRDAANQALARAAPQATLSGIAMAIAPGSANATVRVEPVFFGRALDNLLANSLQYSPANGKIVVELAVSDARGGVLIIDAGPFVPAEFRESVLTESGQSIAKKRYEARYGRGLGLYCAAQAARIAGAEMTLGERDGRFLVELWAPLEQA
jgi:K+-sensing histidine kinase KdpD